MSYADARCCICNEPAHTLDELHLCLTALKQRGNAHEAEGPPVAPAAVFELRCPPCGKRLHHHNGAYRCTTCKVVI